MANPEKHKKDELRHWLEGEEELAVPVSSRGSHVVGAYIKASKSTAPKVRPALTSQPQAKPEVALLREPAPPARPADRPSQAASPDHFRKLDRLPKLRAPVQGKAPAPAPATPRAPIINVARRPARTGAGRGSRTRP